MIKLLRNLVIIGLVLALLITAVAAAVMAANGWDLKDLRRETRIALGLPKFWTTNFNEDALAATPVECPDGDALVIVTGGQSNAANSYGPIQPFEPDPRTAMAFNGRCYALTTPVLGATGRGESLWPRLGAELVATYDRPVIFINGAVGGSQVSDWLDRRSSYLNRLAAQIKEARALGFEPDLVFWIRGETDAAVQVDPKDFARDLANVKQAIEVDAAMPEGVAQWVFFRSTRCLDRPNNGPELEAAMAALAAPKDDAIHLGPSLTTFSDELRRDKCHLNAAGRDQLVEDTLQFLSETGLATP